MTEEKALARLEKGDAAGLRWCIGRYTPYVSTVVWNILGAHGTVQDAEEITADVFWALWQSGNKPAPGKLRAWLGVVARNKALNALKSRGFALPLEERMLTTEGPERILEEEERKRLVRAAVEAMKPPDREIFLRHYFYGQPAVRIAGELGMTDDAVRQRLKRGREKLRQSLEKGGFLDEL